MRLLDIKEDSARDLSMHYSGAILYDEKTSTYMAVQEIEGNNERVKVYFKDSRKVDQRLDVAMKYVCENIKAVDLADGFVNLNGYALYLEREIERRYKKVTTTGNTMIEPLGKAYISVNKKKVKRQIDAYTVLKAMQSRYYGFNEAVSRTQSMFSVAMTPQLALVKQPVTEGPEPIHVVYNTVYIGRIDGENISFESQELRELVLDQLKEVGYAGA